MTLIVRWLTLTFKDKYQVLIRHNEENASNYLRNS